MQTYITREQDYALRIIAKLAKLYPKEQISISKLSKELFISRIFTAKIVHKLKHKGLIGTTQGKNGGVFLCQNPNKISIYDVIEKIGFTTRINECLGDNKKCGLMKFCEFHIYFENLENDIHKKLKQKKITEFITN